VLATSAILYFIYSCTFTHLTNIFKLNSPNITTTTTLHQQTFKKKKKCL
jgi:hypothetical protein